MSGNDPQFIAQAAVCYYPISTIYDSCPRYLFYALLLASCVTRWTGWLADVFLGAAATYAGTAAFEAFILVASPPRYPTPQPVSIPFISNNTTLWSDFPELVTEQNQLMIQPGALELDADAILAIVVTGYLVFLPLQCWSRILYLDRARTVLFYIWNILMLAGSICALVYWPNLERTPEQFMFCYSDLAPFERTSSDGWQAAWRSSTWNTSVWDIFTNSSKWEEIGDICFNPCYNTSQILRQQTSLIASVAADDFQEGHHHRFWDKIIYSKRYIYSLIVMCVILNFLLLTFKLLPYKSRIPSPQLVVIWKQRKTVLNGLKENFWSAIEASKPAQSEKTTVEHRENKRTICTFIRPIFTTRFASHWLHFIIDIGILFALLFSIIISPLTVIAFVVWIEWYIHSDGPSQESPQQVGQWSYLLSIGLLVISAAILTLKHKLASREELDHEIQKTKEHLESLQRMRDLRVEVESADG